MNKKILYIDMDGVIADFDGAMAELTGKPFSTDWNHPEIERLSAEVHALCVANPDIFHNLKPVPDSIEYVKKLMELYEVYFLSTPMWELPESFIGKRLWIEQHFGELGLKRLILTHRKDLNHGDYLIDDTTRHGVDAFKGEHIHIFTDPAFRKWKHVYEYLHYVATQEVHCVQTAPQSTGV